MRKTLFTLFVILLTGSCLQGCQTIQTTSAGAVGIDREQRVLSFISEKELQASAAQAYAQQVQAFKSKGKLNENPETVQRVRNIVTKLRGQIDHFRTDAKTWPWEVNIATSPELNAYVMPGGKIMVYTGLIQKLQATDAELAAVLGHEISHALREHSRERVSRAYGQQLAFTLGAAALGLDTNTTALANAIADVTFQLPHSREQEQEADLIGLELMARAGYDPHAAISLWQKMQQASSGEPPQFLSTHPSSRNRIEQLRAHLPQVLPLYQNRKLTSK